MGFFPNFSFKPIVAPPRRLFVAPFSLADLELHVACADGRLDDADTTANDMGGASDDKKSAAAAADPADPADPNGTAATTDDDNPSSIASARREAKLTALYAVVHDCANHILHGDYLAVLRCDAARFVLMTAGIQHRLHRF